MTGWSETSIGKVCEVIAGQSPKSSDYNDVGDGLPFYQGKKDFTDRYLSPPTKWTTSVTKRALPNDILMSVRAPVGPTNVATQEICIGRGLAAIRAGGSINEDFLWYALMWMQPSIKGNDGAVFPSINKRQIEALNLPLPPLEEQKRIVAALDQAFAALDRARVNAEANLADAEELFASALDEALIKDVSDWELKPLKELGTVQTGSTPKTSEPENYGDFLPFIKPGDFAPDGTLNYDNQGLSEQGAASARKVASGSALMVCIGATIGKAGYSKSEIATNQQINSLSPLKEYDGEFLYYQFLTPTFQKAVLARSGQATLPIINKTKWSDLEIAIPNDIAIQRAVAKKLRNLRAEVDRMIAFYRDKLHDLEDLRQSILQKAFAGELT